MILDQKFQQFKMIWHQWGLAVPEITWAAQAVLGGPRGCTLWCSEDCVSAGDQTRFSHMQSICPSPITISPAHLTNSFLFVYFCFEATPSCVQVLVLVLDPGIIPGGDWGILKNARDGTQICHMPSMCHPTYCIISLAPTLRSTLIGIWERREKYMLWRSLRIYRGPRAHSWKWTPPLGAYWHMNRCLEHEVWRHDVSASCSLPFVQTDSSLYK